jgi:hypothetical protein
VWKSSRKIFARWLLPSIQRKFVFCTTMISYAIQNSWRVVSCCLFFLQCELRIRIHNLQTNIYWDQLQPLCRCHIISTFNKRLYQLIKLGFKENMKIMTWQVLYKINTIYLLYVIIFSPIKIRIMLVWKQNFAHNHY